jgi:rod shape determining protein RodA
MKLEKRNKRKFRIDLFILLPAILLSIIGVITLLSTTLGIDGVFEDTEIVNKQIAFLIIGFISYLLISLIDISLLKHWEVVLPIYIGTLLLLLSVFIWGPEINGVQRWLVVGGIQIQPSEIAKIIVIFTTACVFGFKDRYNQWLLLLISFLLVLPLIILIYLEPAGSMSLLTLTIWFLVAFTGLSNQLRNTVALILLTLFTLPFLLISITGNWIYIILGIVGVILSIFAYYFRDTWRLVVILSVVIGIVLGLSSLVMYKGVLREYQKDRIEAFLNPTENSGDIGFNVNQARIAIGSGQIWGKGFGNGTQSKRDFLPEHQTDFIYASFAEEFGLVGSLFLLFLFSVIIIRGLVVSVDNSNDSFLSMILIGIVMKILLEIFINVGTNTGLIPATGIPLPLISAGGTITVMTLFALGVIQSI